MLRALVSVVVVAATVLLLLSLPFAASSVFFSFVAHNLHIRIVCFGASSTGRATLGANEKRFPL